MIECNFDAKRARAKRPLPLWVDAFRRDTSHLEADEIGAYISILMCMWSSVDLSLPDDPKRLSRAAGVSLRLWNSRISEAIYGFFTICKTGITQGRLAKEAAYTERQVTHQHNRKYGKKHAKPLKTNNAYKTGDLPGIYRGKSYPITQLPNIREEDTNVSLSFDHNSAFDIYNEFAEENGWPKCQKISKPRIAKMKARLKDAGGIDGWRSAMGKASDSDFLCNRANANFTASIDFLLQEKSFTKLMEGNYDNRDHNASKTTNRQQDRSDALAGEILAAARAR